MKTIRLLTMAASMLYAATINAQQTIEQAFRELQTHNGIITSKYSSQSKNSETGKKESQVEIFDFSIPMREFEQIRSIEQAFLTDMGQAYTSASGSSTELGGTPISLAVGNDNSNGVIIAALPKTSYIYACFIDNSDEAQNHRYAYAIEYRKVKKSYKGRIIKTYALTQNERAKNLNAKTYKMQGIGRADLDIINLARNANDSILQSLNNLNGERLSEILSELSSSTVPVINSAATSTSVYSNSGSWLGAFGVYSDKFREKPNGNAASIYASQIYELCKKANVLTKVEKNLVCGEVSDMSKLTSNKYVKMLLTAAIKALIE